MKIVTVKQNQTVFDVAIEQYGTCESIEEILQNNIEMKNDPAALSELGIDVVGNDGFYIDAPLLSGLELQIDTESKKIRNNVLQEIDVDVTTFDI